VLPLPLEHNLQPLILAQLGGELHWETNISRSHLPNHQLCVSFCLHSFGKCCGYESGQILTVWVRVSDPDPVWSRIQEGKNDPQK
jgi:hypothetical protein